MHIFGSFLVLATAVAAIPSPNILKNSERLARNLPPLPPIKFGRTLPGHVRSVDDPTPVQVARPSASATPVSYVGKIQVRQPNNATEIGCVENNQRGPIGVHSPGDPELVVNFQTTSYGSKPFDIVAQDPKFTGPPYLGGVSANSSSKLTVGSADVVAFKNVNQTLRQSLPVQTQDGFVESAIWSYDRQTKRITPQWINPDGNKASTVIVYNAQENILFFVGDIEAYSHANSEKEVLIVEFYLKTSD